MKRERVMTPEQETDALRWYWHSLNNARRGFRDHHLANLRRLWAKWPRGEAKLRREYRDKLQTELILVDDRLAEFLDHQFGHNRLRDADKAKAAAKAARNAIHRAGYRELRRSMRLLLWRLENLIDALGHLVLQMLKSAEEPVPNASHITETLTRHAEQHGIVLRPGDSNVDRCLRYRRGGSIHG